MYIAGFPVIISIHAPYAGSDIGATIKLSGEKISIHAPYAGSDKINALLLQTDLNFNPRSLYRERRGRGGRSDRRLNFNPRSLYRERLAARHLELE